MKNLILFRKLARNKKGLDDDLTDIIIAVIFTAMIFIFVFMFFTSTNRIMENSAMEKSQNLEKNYILLNYLRAPMKESKLSIAEYLGFSTKKELEGSMKSNRFCCDKDTPLRVYKCTKDGQLTKEANEILKDVANWRVGMFISGGKEFCYITKGVQQQRRVPIPGETVKATIPSNDLSFNIEMYFKFKS